jgi:hypothetical protein
MPTIWDGLLQTGRPDMSAYGFRTTYKLLGQIGSNGVSGAPIPDPATVDARLASAGLSAGSNFELVVVDEETWNAVSEIDKFIELAKMCKASASWPTKAKLAFYGVFPPGSYFGPGDYPSGATWDAWLSNVETTKALIPFVDAICPSLYNFYRDLSGHEQVMRVVIKTIRERTQKPLYPFHWHQFHEGGSLPPADISAISKANPARVTIADMGGGEPGTNLQTGDFVFLGRGPPPPTYPDIGGMVEIRNTLAHITKIDNSNIDLIGINSTAFTTYTSGGAVGILAPVDQLFRQMEVSLKEADGFVLWGGFLQTLDPNNQPYWKAITSFTGDIPFPVLILNGATVVAICKCSARNIRKVVAAHGGNGWCFADSGPASTKVVGNTITGQSNGSSLLFYPSVT